MWGHLEVRPLGDDKVLRPPDWCPCERDPWVLPCSVCPRRTDGKMAVHEAARGSLPDTESSGTLTLEFPAPRAVINKCLLFIMQVNYNSGESITFCCNSHNGWRHPAFIIKPHCSTRNCLSNLSYLLWTRLESITYIYTWSFLKAGSLLSCQQMEKQAQRVESLMYSKCKVWCGVWL